MHNTRREALWREEVNGGWLAVSGAACIDFHRHMRTSHHTKISASSRNGINYNYEEKVRVRMNITFLEFGRSIISSYKLLRKDGINGGCG